MTYKLSFSEQRKNMNTWYEQEKDIEATPSNLKKSLDLPRALDPQLSLSFPLDNKSKNNKHDYIKLKRCFISKLKRHLMEWEKILEIIYLIRD